MGRNPSARCREFQALILFSLPMVLASCRDDMTGPRSHTAGAKGGTVALAKGAVHLLISAGTLWEEVSFSATEATDFLESDLLVPGSTFEIGPSTTHLEKMVTVTLSYDPSSLPAGVREPELRLVQEDSVQDGLVAWVELPSQSVDTLSHEVSGRTQSLGVFGVKGVDVAYVKVSPGFYVLEKGESHGFSASAKDATGTYLPERAISWASTNDLVASVDAGGGVTGMKEGTAVIRAEAEGRAGMAEVTVIGCEDQTQIPGAECSALLDIFDRANNRDWRVSGAWTPTPEPCGWRGVTCTGDRVGSLDLSGMYLDGALSNALVDLSELRYLSVLGNNFSGPIPAFLGNLSELTYLNLGRNSFSGPLPAPLQDLEGLSVLNVSFNDLSGPIPGWLGSLRHLTELNLARNAFSGPLPSGLDGLSELANLQLSRNQISGSLPPELGQLTGLQILDLTGNQLSGSIPAELGNLTNLEVLLLDGNQLGGAMPTELGSLSNLDLLYIMGNNLSGQIPLAVAQLGGRIQGQPGGGMHCVFTPPGNESLEMPDTQEFRDADLDGNGTICGVRIGG